VMEAAKAVFKAYFTAELWRSSGLVYSLIQMSLWIVLFITPLALFAPPGTNPSLISGYAFVAVLVFMSYSTATWDWAWEVRWLMRTNILEYVIASGRSIYILYVGVMPVSLIWMAMALGSVYVILALLLAPPAFIITNPLLLVYSLILLTMVLFGHSMILAGSILSYGTSGPVMELISWILPIATGGLVPLVNLPWIAAEIALYTPYAYPAELVRAALLGTPTLLGITPTTIIGAIYGVGFLAASILYFEHEYRKVLKEGIRSVGMY
jgi:ABC-2 type transport system permease protein